LEKLGIGIAYAATVTMAFVPILIGSIASLGEKQETMTKKDALMFPVVASGVLFGLYILFRLFSKDHINLLLTIYFLAFGAFALTSTFSPIFAIFIPSSKEYNIKIPVVDYELKFNNADVVAGILSVAAAVWYALTKNWIINNVIGFCFCIQGIAMLSITSFQIAGLLLTGLFFYDIFWVFGTDVMVTVAKNFDAPVKLLFPRNIFASTYQYSMLGLGDIVIPGIFIALMLRFDRKNAFPNKSVQDLAKSAYNSFDKFYFSSTLVAYVLGLVTTIAVMHTFKAAQPALLYLVPYCLGFALFTAVRRGEIGKLWSYTEEVPEDDKKTK